MTYIPSVNCTISNSSCCERGMFLLYCLHFVLIVAFGYEEVNYDQGQDFNDKRLAPVQLNIVDELAKVTKRLDQQQIEIQNLTKKLSEKENEAARFKVELEKRLNAGTGAGATYIRWGRNICPGNNTDRIYKGYMGGSPYVRDGGSVDYLCLSADPQWDHYDVNIDAGGRLTGVEYEFPNFRHQDGASQFFGQNIYDDNAPCAVCHSQRGASVMIPGRTECYSGWNKEYSGYIVGEFDRSIGPSKWICLDRRPEVIPGGEYNDQESLLSMVEASCGKSLKCPPYIQGREITCVVCTK